MAGVAWPTVGVVGLTIRFPWVRARSKLGGLAMCINWWRALLVAGIGLSLLAPWASTAQAVDPPPTPTAEGFVPTIQVFFDAKYPTAGNRPTATAGQPLRIVMTATPKLVRVR